MTQNKIIRSSFIIMFFTVLSKLLGFFRETLIAYKFGATSSSDIYMFAVGMATLIFVSFGVGINTTFIPILTEYIEKRSYEDRNRFVNNIINTTVIITILMTIVGVLFTDYIVYLFAPGFNNNLDIFINAVKATRLMFLSLIFIGSQFVFTGILQSHKEFSIPASMAIFSNVILIVYLFFSVEKQGVLGLIIVTIITYFVQFIIHVPKFLKLGYKYKLIIDFKDEGLRKMFRLMIPVIIGTSITQVNILVDRMLATTVGEGSIAVLNFANKLNMFVYSIFAVAISTVAYSSLSTYSVQDNMDKFKSALTKSINVILLVMIPATIGLAVLRYPIINILFKRGAFDDSASKLTAIALLFYAPSMIVYGVRDILNRAFYSVKDTRTPMINSVIGVITNIVLNIILVKYMGLGGLALATSISAIFITLLLLVGLNKKIKDIGLRSIFNSFAKIVIASIIMGIMVYITNRMSSIYFTFGFKGEVLSTLVSVLIGMISYSFLVYILKVDEFIYIVNLFKMKIKKYNK